MKRGAWIICIIGFCAFSFAQNLEFSRRFEAFKKNVPLALINSQPGCFYVLRYNKAVHDLTIEKRAKPSAEIMGFTPLKLDSVNAGWFDYENLDYLFFEQHKKLYFLFEKITNSKKALYLKVIDSLSKSSGFAELVSLEKEKNIQDFDLSFKLSGNSQVLIVASQVLMSGPMKKTVYLYDAVQRKMLWTKKLPFESASTGYSSAFECNQGGHLFYVLTKSRVVGYKRKYQGQAQLSIPVFYHDSLHLVSYPPGHDPLLHKVPLLANVSSLNGIRLLASGDSVTALAHINLQINDSAEADTWFFAKKFSAGLDNIYYTSSAPLAGDLKNALTFYDGSDYKYASEKEYRPLKKYVCGNSVFQFSERRDENYYKELIIWQTGLQTGQVARQYLVPRKVFTFKSRTRFKNIGEAMLAFSGDTLNLFMLEATGNFKKDPTLFNYHKFSKETNLWRANIVRYTIYNGSVKKELVYRNADFDLVPLLYTSGGVKDDVFYLSSGKYEKFAILKQNP